MSGGNKKMCEKSEAALSLAYFRNWGKALESRKLVRKLRFRLEKSSHSDFVDSCKEEGFYSHNH